MKLTFQLTRPDLHSFYMYQFWEAPAQRAKRNRGKVWYGLMLFALPLIFCYTSYRGITLNIFLAVLPVSLLLFFAGYSFLAKFGAASSVKRALKKIIKQYGAERLTGNCTLEITPDSVVSTIGSNTASMSLEDIEELAEYGAHYFLVMNTGDAIPIPKNAFGSEAEEEGFRALMKDWMV